jgi:predicted glutamine amidotransferase
MGIEGTTDSEHAFAVFLNLLPAADRRVSAGEMRQTLVRTVVQLEQWIAEAGISEPSYSNFAVTDGHSMSAIRFVSDQQLEPVSLYYSVGRNDAYEQAASQGISGHSRNHPVIVASERLTERKSDWVRVAPNHVLTVTADQEVTVELMHADRTRNGR